MVVKSARTRRPAIAVRSGTDPRPAPLAAVRGAPGAEPAGTEPPREHERQVLAEQIVARDECDLDRSKVERVFRTSCSGHHWATLVQSTATPEAGVAGLVGFARTVAHRVGDRSPVIVLCKGEEVWMWTRWTTPPGPGVIASVRASLPRPDGLRISSGPVLTEFSGFRRSMLAARLVQKTISGSSGAGWYDYAEISPISMLVGDREWAHCFTEATLGDLGRNDEWSTTLRDTLRSYLAHGRSRQEVAAEMHLNRNTVAYRVAKAEQLLGRSVEKDTFTLRLALEIVRIDRTG